MTPEQVIARRKEFRLIAKKLGMLLEDATLRPVDEVCAMEDGKDMTLTLTNREWRLMRTAVNTYIYRYLE